MAAAIRYFSLFLPTTRDIPAEKSWKLWLPMFSDFWQTWGSSPVWEVDLLRLYSRLAFHRVGEVGHWIICCFLTLNVGRCLGGPSCLICTPGS